MTNDANTAAGKRHEARVRRMPAAMGLVLRKSRTRDENRMDFARTGDGTFIHGTAGAGRPEVGEMT